MTPLMQFCMVVLTLSAVVVAVVVVGSAIQFLRLANELRDSSQKVVQAVQESVSNVQGVTHRIDGMMSSLGQTVPSIQRVVHEFEQVGDRAAQLSNAVLEEIEVPVRSAVAVVRGVKTGTQSFVNALTRRARMHSTMNGGQS